MSAAASCRLIFRASRFQTAFSPVPPSILHTVNSTSFRLNTRAFSSMPPKKGNSQTNGTVALDAHQYQSGDTTHRKQDEWKHREPYAIHGDNENFPVKWKGTCHCGKVKYSLSRDKPLASKYCHCTTCQRLHGVSHPEPPTAFIIN